MLQDKGAGAGAKSAQQSSADGVSCDQQLQVLAVSVTETRLSVDRGTVAGERFERV